MLKTIILNGFKLFVCFATCSLLITSIGANAVNVAKPETKKMPLSFDETRIKSVDSEARNSNLRDRINKKLKIQPTKPSAVIEPCDGISVPCGTLNLVQNKLKPVFSSSYNNKAADRINIVFVFSDTYTNSPVANLANLQALIQENSVPNLSGTPTVNFGQGYGFFSVEPMRSNKSKFNFWYYEDKFSSSAPDVVGEEFQTYETELGLNYLAPVFLNANVVRDNASLASVVIDFKNGDTLTNYFTGYGRVIEMPQAPAVVTNVGTFVHEAGHFLFGLKDEYIEPGSTANPSYGLPNCALYKSQAEAVWGSKLGQVDPFFNTVVSQLQAAGYPSNLLPLSSEIAINYINRGCFSSEIKEQYTPSRNSLMNTNATMPVFGSHNRSIVESVLSKFSGGTAILPKPGYDIGPYDPNSAKVNVFHFFNPNCSRVLTMGRTYLECSFKKIPTINKTYLNENNSLALSYNNAANGNLLTKIHPCLISMDGNYINCERIDITGISAVGELNYYNDSWIFTIVDPLTSGLHPTFRNLNSIPAINADTSINYFTDNADKNTVRQGGVKTKSFDFNKDGSNDLVWWREVPNGGDVHIWKMINGLKSGNSIVLPVLSKDSGFHLQGMGDFDGDGDGDLLWRNSLNGEVFIWIIENGVVTKRSLPNLPLSSQWHVAAIGNFDASTGSENTDDILWRKTDSGENHVWKISNGQRVGNSGISSNVPVGSKWFIVAVCNLYGAKTDQVIWFNSVTRDIHIWNFENGARIFSTVNNSVGGNWEVVGCLDANNDKQVDVLFRDSNDGNNGLWLNEVGSKVSGLLLPRVSIASGWEIKSVGKYGIRDIIAWRNKFSGDNHLWMLNSAGNYTSSAVNGSVSPDSGWNNEKFQSLVF